MKTTDSPSHVRRAQIVSLSLTELMLLLVFMTIAFSFLAKEEGLKEVPRIQIRLNELEAENSKLRSDNAMLKARVAALEYFLKGIGIDGKTLTPPKDGEIRFPDGTTFVRKEGRAPGKPQCRLTRKFLLHLFLLPNNQIRGERYWSDEDSAKVSTLPGIASLTSGQALSLGEFSAAAGLLKSYSLSRDGCVYAVRTTRQTNDADAFDAELAAVELYFNVSRRQ